MKYTEETFAECFQAIAQNIKKVRLKNALTQKQMSEMLDINSQYYARLERGGEPNRNFTLDKIFLICSLFNISPNDLMTKLPDVEETNLESIKKDKKKRQMRKGNGLRE